VTVFIKPGWEWPGHEPGQYLRIGFLVDGVHHWRAYSLTSDPGHGGFYVRQLLGAANIDGSPLFHVASGNLGYQAEHPLYPDMPSTRYAEIAPRVRAICERYELPYNTGPFLRQLGGVQRTIVRLAFPGGSPRPKPGPFRGDGDRDRNGASGQAATSTSSSSTTAA
jgi:fatty acid desaturase